MLRRPVAPLLIPLRLVIDGEESTIFLRPPNADDLAGLPSSVKTGLVGEVVSAPPPDEPVAVKPGKTGPEPLERVADAAMRRFQPQIAAVLADPGRLTGLVGEALGALAARSQAQAADEDAAARHLLVRCVQAQLDDAGDKVPLRFVALPSEEEPDPLHLIWIGHFPSLRALWAPLREVIVKGTPTFRA